MDFEIYESIEGRKRRFVVSESLEMFSKSNMVDYACKYFHVAPNRLVLTTGYVLNNQLYWIYPKNKKAKEVWVIFTRRKS